MRRTQSRQSTTLLLLVLTFVSFACNKNAPAPPPPPPPSTAAAPSAPVQPAIPAPTITLRADSVTLTRGGSITLTWDARNATTVDIQPGIGQVAALGSRQVSPASSVTYSATATGPGGPPASDTLRITVNEPAPAANPPAARGGNVVLSPTPTLSASELFDRNMQAINFDYDKSDVRDDQKPKLQTAANYLRANAGVQLTVEGHADERGSEEYNLALGDRRANAVKEALVGMGVAENRLNSVSYGEERPVCRFETEECYAQNRRAAFKINP